MLLDKRYRIEKIIKAGGMGTVYLAKDMAMNEKFCAVKEMKERFSDKTERQLAINRFLSEIQTLSSLSHPNIPLITNHFLEKDSFYFVMEFIEGTDLATLLKEAGNPALQEESVISFSCQVIEALIYLHSLNPPVIHRDIKPSNLVLRHKDNRILLIDFGIARVTDPGGGIWMGTPGYAAPEQQKGSPSPASDIFSLGATMFELLTGIKASNFDASVFKKEAKISQNLKEIVLKSLHNSVKDRFKSAVDMKREFASLVKIPYSPEEHDELYSFHQAVLRLRNCIIEPAVNKFIRLYGNECLTKWVPKNLDYFVFSFACPVAFEMIIKKNITSKMLEFYKKSGPLEEKKLGQVNPEDENSNVQTERILQIFIEDYEDFKSSGWRMNP